jgi:hypothetical protein
MVKRIRKKLIINHLKARGRLEKSRLLLTGVAVSDDSSASGLSDGDDVSDYSDEEFNARSKTTNSSVSTIIVSELKFNLVISFPSVIMKYNTNFDNIGPLIANDANNMNKYIHQSINVDTIGYLLLQQMRVPSDEPRINNLIGNFFLQKPEIELKLLSGINCKGNDKLEMSAFKIHSNNGYRKNKRDKTKFVDNFSCLEINLIGNIKTVKVASIISIRNKNNINSEPKVYLVVIPFINKKPNQGTSILPYPIYGYETITSGPRRGQIVSEIVELDVVNGPACVIAIGEAREERIFTSEQFMNGCHQSWRYRQIFIPKLATFELKPNAFEDDGLKRKQVNPDDDINGEAQLPLDLEDDAVHEIYKKRHKKNDEVEDSTAVENTAFDSNSSTENSDDDSVSNNKDSSSVESSDSSLNASDVDYGKRKRKKQS